MKQPNLRLGLVACLVLFMGTVRTAPPPRTGPAEIQRLIRQLGSESFPEREAASQELAAVGEPALQALRAALQDTDAEIRRLWHTHGTRTTNQTVLEKTSRARTITKDKQRAGEPVN